jgi:hypothetical protein
LQGASATEQVLQENNGANVRVFVVWEPGLATDFATPSTSALARIPDIRASQYWDRKRVLSRLLGERNRSTVVWDSIAVYAPGTFWHDTPPKPIYYNGPVARFHSAMQQTLGLEFAVQFINPPLPLLVFPMFSVCHATEDFPP